MTARLISQSFTQTLSKYHHLRMVLRGRLKESKI
jgi:hypothetical protein